MGVDYRSLLDIDLVEVARTSKDICLMGNKGVGKTTVLTLLGFLNWYIFDAEVYSNYVLTFPHILIDSFEEFDKISFSDSKKVYLGDDFEYWFHSRNWKKNINLSEVLLFWGKKSCSLIYSTKRPMAIDVSLRDSTVEFWDVSLRQRVYNKDKFKNEFLKKYLNFLMIECLRLNSDLDDLGTLRIKDLVAVSRLFDTKGMVNKLDYVQV